MPDDAHHGRRSRTRRVLKRLALGLLLASSLAATYGATVWLALWVSVRVPDVAVPDVVDRTLDEARALLAGAGLEARVVGRRFDPDEPEGKVVEQQPAPHARTKPGRAVRLILSAGPPLARMPDLLGGSLGRARIALAAVGLRLANSASVPHPSVPVGRVIAQYPQAGAEVGTGSAVSLLVSAGAPPREYVMPDLSGRPVTRARRLLERAGIDRIRLRGLTGPEAVVVGQRPPAGARVSTSDVVVLATGAPVSAPGLSAKEGKGEG